jgi:hypothetical protein
LKIINKDIIIPFEPLMPLDEAKALLEQYATHEDKRYAGQVSRVLENAVKIHESGEEPEADFVYLQTLVGIGPVAFVPFPFEVFSEISLRLRAYSPFGHTLIMGCTNGSNSYLPTQDQIIRGGYEINQFRWGRPRQLPDDTDIRLINQNLEILNDLHKGGA